MRIIIIISDNMKWCNSFPSPAVKGNLVTSCFIRQALHIPIYLYVHTYVLFYMCCAVYWKKKGKITKSKEKKWIVCIFPPGSEKCVVTFYYGKIIFSFFFHFLYSVAILLFTKHFHFLSYSTNNPILSQFVRLNDYDWTGCTQLHNLYIQYQLRPSDKW